MKGYSILWRKLDAGSAGGDARIGRAEGSGGVGGCSPTRKQRGKRRRIEEWILETDSCWIFADGLIYFLEYLLRVNFIFQRG